MFPFIFSFNIYSFFTVISKTLNDPLKLSFISILFSLISFIAMICIVNEMDKLIRRVNRFINNIQNIETYEENVPETSIVKTPKNTPKNVRFSDHIEKLEINNNNNNNNNNGTIIRKRRKISKDSYEFVTKDTNQNKESKNTFPKNDSDSDSLILQRKNKVSFLTNSTTNISTDLCSLQPYKKTNRIV